MTTDPAVSGAVAGPKFDYAWQPVRSLVQISGATTTQQWFMPAASTYVRVPLGLTWKGQWGCRDH